eukprot:Selendium_serpulae@DN1397_c0_g1_i1.p1
MGHTPNQTIDPPKTVPFLRQMDTKETTEKRKNFITQTAHPRIKTTLRTTTVFQPQHSGHSALPPLVITEQMVKQHIHKLKPTTALGPDTIPMVILKKLVDVVSRPLAMLFHRSLKTGSLPQQWRDAIITPIYKGKGKRTTPAQYRPVSVTAAVVKVIESIIAAHIREFLEMTNWFSAQQHGSRQLHSCQSNLVCLLDAALNTLRNKRQLDIVYLDFKQAFDHAKLLAKAQAAGIEGEILTWLAAWLSGRGQQVKVGDTLSDHRPVTSSIVQGSVLGPLLFIIFTNDMPTAKASALQFGRLQDLPPNWNTSRLL